MLHKVPATEADWLPAVQGLGATSGLPRQASHACWELGATHDKASVLQVHLFIFYMAITHILGGIALIMLASLRIRFWRRWTEQADHISQE